MSGADVRASIGSLMQSIAAAEEAVGDQERSHRREIEGLLREVMDIADSLERMQRTATPAEAASLQAVVAQVQELLSSRSILAFRPAVGSQVDGRLCEVMATVVRPGMTPGTVTYVVRSGYRGGERIIRRAGVETVKEQA